MLKQFLLLGLIFIIVDAGFLYLMSNNFQTMIKKIQGSFMIRLAKYHNLNLEIFKKHL